ncbi:WS/DGAT/MGAT family O-acyltransferase [Parachitinimonas caeni]|uniref:diacylglycerol O-acyltransferase n=1 Tax=Parachitinimonas caeni TaxID=3031301 RepID=A0ABT7E381_9NEIS|nr:wax ester/triacylglycerol synthase family O-acyltransferase [Parachitinimonas caeni]MDK2126783.1 wax ester/triacylglycerol synthase family O-acyltransferase [Parachitinimonas caeni]
MFLNFLSSPKRESMSSIDTAWLRMDRPTNLMVINGVLFFETQIDFERLKRVIEARLLKYKRFKQKVVRIGTNAYWEDDPDFDLANHFHLIALPGKAGKAELEKMMSEMISTPLDFSKPLWQFYVVENYAGGSALVARIHHSIGDGIALIQVLLSMTDKEANPAAPEKALKTPKFVAGDEEDSDDFFMRLYKPVSKMYTGMLKSYYKLVGTSYGLMMNPGKLLDYTQTGLGVSQGLAKLATMPSDPRTKFKGKQSTAKRIAWAESLPLQEVKDIGKVLGCSVNDILLSAVAGALRGYLMERGENVDGLDIRASVPVNLRPENRLGELGNYFGLVFLSLPIGIANPIERVYEVKRRMNAIKGSYEAVVALGLLSVVGMLPDMLEQGAIELFSTKATAVMTNVPGPRERIYMAGAGVKDLNFWVPQSGEITMGVSILSYNNRVNFGVMTDKKLVPDPENIIRRFSGEFEKLVLTVLMQTWEEAPDPQLAEINLGLMALVAGMGHDGRPKRVV